MPAANSLPLNSASQVLHRMSTFLLNLALTTAFQEKKNDINTNLMGEVKALIHHPEAQTELKNQLF